MKARKLILSLGIAALTLSGPLAAESHSALRAAVQADAGASIQAARAELVRQSNGLLTAEVAQSIIAPDRLFPAITLVLDEASEPETGPENSEGLLSGLVVYSGNR